MKMKKCVLLLVAACLLFPLNALAAGDQMGVYVAPKFIYGIETFKMKGRSASESISMGSGTDTVFGGALAVGYDFNKRFDVPVRVELEYSAFSQGEDSKTFYNPVEDDWAKLKGKIDVQSLFANVYYDFHNSTAFTPYVGAGIGLSFVGMKGSLTDSDARFSLSKKTRTNFAWNVGVGCAYDFNDYFALDLGYRYAHFGKAETKSFNAADFEAPMKGKSNAVAMHQFMLAARFTF